MPSDLGPTCRLLGATALLLAASCRSSTPTAPAAGGHPARRVAPPTLAESTTAYPGPRTDLRTARPAAIPHATAAPTSPSLGAPTETAVSVPILHEPPIADLRGRIVWLGRDGAAAALDLASMTLETLWVAEAWESGSWSVAPDGLRVAYRTSDERIAVRQLVPGAEERLVSPPLPPGSERSDPHWSEDGSEIAYGEHGETIYFEDTPWLPCGYKAAVPEGVVRTLWSGELESFPGSAGCPDSFFWLADRRRLAVRPIAFEASASERIDLLDESGTGVVQRIDVLIEHRSVAQSPDGHWLAFGESALYYGSKWAVGPAYAKPPRWPGTASLRLLNLVSGAIVDVASWQTQVGLTHPVWAPDGSWLAVAEPVGSFEPPTPRPPYPPLSADDPEFRVDGTMIHVVTREGTPIANLAIGSPFALPLAVSPDGRHVLTVVAGSATEIHVYRTSDGAGGGIATLPKGSQSISWVP